MVLKVYGRVQLVMYRDFTQRKAKKLGLTGYVINQKDKTVKVVAEGKEKELKEIINKCYNGPILAKVEKIDIDWKDYTGQFDKFEIKY